MSVTWNCLYVLGFAFGVIIGLRSNIDILNHFCNCTCPGTENAELNELRNQIFKLNQNIKELKKTTDDLEKDNSKLKSNHKSCEDRYSTTLARLSNTLAIDNDKTEGNNENTAIKNRPTKVAEQYLLLCSNEWLEAKEAIDKIIVEDDDEVTKVLFLKDIMLLAEREAKLIHSKVYLNIMEPFNQFPLMAEKLEKNVLPPVITNSVGDFLRNRSEHVNMHSFEQLINDKLDEAYPHDSSIWQKTKDVDEVIKYIRNVTRIVWKMVIQRPSMELQVSGEWRGTEFAELYYRSEVKPDRIPSTPVTIHTIYPTLYHGKQIMEKGTVYVMKRT